MPTATEPAPAFRVIGYVTDWNAAVDEIAFDKLTHINYAFVLPEPDGTLRPLEHPEALAAVVDGAHAQGVQVLISVGGWGLDEAFEAFAPEAAARATFEAALLDFVAEHNLDGVDIDWEYPGPTAKSVEAYTQLMTELAAMLRPQGKLLTAAVAAVGENADGVAEEVFAQVDFLNVMAYDGPEQNHSSLHYAEAALTYWQQRGLPAEQTVLGVPFYARAPEVAYRDLVAADPAAADRDQSPYGQGNVFYNGRPTLRAKVQLAREQASGLMIWALSHDAPGPESLLTAIDAAVHAP